MKRNSKRMIAVLLASVMFFTDCVTGFATESDAQDSVNTEEILSDESENLEDTQNSDVIEDTEETAQDELQEEEEPAYVLYEVEELREQSAKQYRLSDGTILAAQYGMDVHYENEDGEWSEIDNRFIYEDAEDTDDFAGFQSAEGAVEFKFAPQIQDGDLLRITQEEYSVGFRLVTDAEKEENFPEVEIEEAIELEEILEIETELQETELQEAETMEEPDTEQPPVMISFLKGDILNPEEIPEELAAVPAPMSLEETEVLWAEVDSEVPMEEEGELLDSIKVEEAVTSVGYGNVLPGVSLQYVLAGSSLKEYILVNQTAENYSYDFVMDLENLEPEMQEDGSILLKDTEIGTIVYEIPAAYMTDAAGVYSDEVSMTVSENGEGNWNLKIIADAAWINAEERVFPVQIDPTLNKVHNSLSNIRAGYISEAHPSTKYENSQLLLVGYDPEDQETKAYIQFRNLPVLPKNSVISRAVSYLRIVSYSNASLSTMNVTAKEISGSASWSTGFTWSSHPAESSVIMDHQTVSVGNVESYKGWNITELIKKHYKNGNGSNVSTFILSAYDGENMDAYYRGKVQMYLTNSLGFPIMQIIYRDTKGLEGYYTYQTHEAGNAGVAYIGDYNAQLTVIKPVASYQSTVFPYDLNLVYNSAYGDRNFTNDGNNLHTKDFTSARTGQGWKLSAQETVVQTEIEDISGTSSWLVYNDSDGTEHYFKQSSNSANIYEDEDGLNLTITKSGIDFTMEDKAGNKKFFKGGYLQKITDANQNVLHIVYNYGEAKSNLIDGAGSNRITSVWLQPKGTSLADSEKIFSLSYDDYGYVSYIHETYGTSYRLGYSSRSNGKTYLTTVYRLNKETGNYTAAAKYDYDASWHMLCELIDMAAEWKMCYEYQKSPTGCNVSSWYESANDNGTYKKGYQGAVTTDELRKTVYRECGKDRIYGNTDDILTTYHFNSWGHTVNIYSKDSTGKIWGVTANTYGENSGTSKKNNRVLNSVSKGQAGVNILPNGGFEKYSGTTATGWNHHSSGGSITCKTTDPHSGNAHYNLYNETNAGAQMIYRKVNLTKGKTYTASAYVNTQNVQSVATDGGVFLKVLDIDNNQIAEGARITHQTDTQIDNGWQRISVTFTPSATADYYVCISWKHAKGTMWADDVQLEMEDAVSSYNYVYNGSFEEGTTGKDGWTFSTQNMESISTSTVIHGKKSFSISGAPGKVLYAYQTIPINKNSNTTFLLSGWSKGDSVPDIEKTAENTSKKFWGIRLTLNYSDGNTEAHDLTFQEFVHEWQYASMAIVPKRAGKTITTATLRLCYYNNANKAYFDNISLTEEPVQTYKYDDKGNLTTVKSTGNGEETFSYDSTTQNLLNIATAGSGTYTYQYTNTNNKHLPTKITNENVSMDISYSTFGEATATTLTNTRDSLKMTSSVIYEDGLLTYQTDNTGANTSYGYTTDRDCNSITTANGQRIQTYKESTWGNVDRTYQSGVISLHFGYARGNLASIKRGGYITQGGTKYNQIYAFSYDSYGNRTSTSIKNDAGSERVLATYQYNSSNGPLASMTYGPSTGTKVNYAYDNLERVKTKTYSDTGTSYGYKYSADGNLAAINVNGTPTYEYTYDSLGRLIYSARLQNNKPVLYTSHEYDDNDRITNQSWQIGNDSFSESYEYRSADGTLTKMTTGGDELKFTYNNLKQLSKRSAQALDMEYVYRTRKNASNVVFNTTQVASLKYLKSGSASTQLLPTLNYSYDALGNITQIKEGTAEKASYVYDGQNQVVQEILSGKQISNYTYDTYGNIRSKIIDYDDNAQTSEMYTYTYGNGVWRDLLTGITYTDRSNVSHTGNFTYDAVGNPLTYNNGKKNWTFTWKHGRQLATATDGTTTITNTYDVDGIRDSKTVGNVKHTYTTLGGKIVREAYGTYTIDYFYDNDSRPYKMVVKNGTSTVCTGYFVLNLQGDVIAIIDSEGTVAVKYQYDAWGREIGRTKSGDYAENLYKYNALKYRGYYYDADLGLYYLNSRFYDPEIGRFINADGYVSTGQGIMGHNMFAYCVNNPINFVDVEGTSAESVQWWIGNMWWLCGIDSALPIGDIFFVLGAMVCIIENICVPQNNVIPQVALEEKSGDTPESGEVTTGVPPTEKDGYREPKGGPRRGKAKDGKTGWVDKNGNVWVPAPTGSSSAHGGGHWDVQRRDGKGYTNVYPGGKTRPGAGKTPKLAIMEKYVY